MASTAAAPSHSKGSAPTPGTYRAGSLAEVVRSLRKALRYRSHGGLFVALLSEETALLLDAAQALSRTPKGGGLGGTEQMGELLALRQRIRDCAQTLTSDLRRTLFAPVSHEDVALLSMAMRKVLECLVTAGRQRELCESDGAILAASLECALAAGRAVETLPAGRRITVYTRQIATTAQNAKALIRSREREAVPGGEDPIRLMAAIEFRHRMQRLFHRYQELASALDHVVLKNG